MAERSVRTFYEVRPGLSALRYLGVFGLLTLLARSARRRPETMFVHIASTVDRHILSEGLFEKGVIEALRHVVGRTGQADLMIDIGANIGNHSVALAPLFAQVEAVEPHPVLFKILEANVLFNGLGHVRCHNVGLGAEEGSATLVEAPDEHAISRVAERSKLSPETFGYVDGDFGRRFTIEIRNALDFVLRFETQLPRAFVKIDVEGMEQEIVEALLPALRRYRPLLGFELFTRAQPDLVNLVRDLPGYELFGIRVHDVRGHKLLRSLRFVLGGRRNTLERLDPDQLDEVYPLVLLVPAELADRL